MSNLSSIISVTITRQTKPTSQAGFSTVLIVGPNPSFSGRIQFYSSDDLTAIAADLTGGITDEEYLAASEIASQSPKVPIIALGREDVGDTDMTDTLNEIIAESSDWYGLVTAERDVTKQTDAGAWTLANKKLYATSSADVNIIDQNKATDTTSLAYIFNNAANDRVSIFYKADAATKYADAAYLGYVLALQPPGSWTGHAKTLAGVSADDLTPTQSINAHDKMCNTYEEIGEVNVVLSGWVSNGEYTDIIVFADWLKARITEDVWIMMINLPKIPYTDNGITAIENVVRKRLRIGQNNGGLSPDSFDPITNDRTGGYETSVPLAADVPTADKTNRILKNVKFTGWLSGAIHYVEIQGILVL